MVMVVCTIVYYSNKSTSREKIVYTVKVVCIQKIRIICIIFIHIRFIRITVAVYVQNTSMYNSTCIRVLYSSNSAKNIRMHKI